MGPRSADRGITLDWLAGDSSHFAASMGPRSADRGISRHSNYSIVNDLRYGQREAVTWPSMSHLSQHPFLHNHRGISPLEAASGSATFRIDPPLASPGNKDRVLIQFSFQNLREQPRLYLQQSAVRDPVTKDGMRHQRVHSCLVSLKEAAPAYRR